MKALTTNGLTELITLIKSTFLDKNSDVIDVSDALASVAISGSYNDLSNKPTIPTVNNATLTIQKNGTIVNTFTANASSNVTANITVPTKTSDLTNDDGFITGITSSDVTTALGYTPYNSSNPNGYTSNVGTVTSVNNVSPVNGNVSLTIPSEVTESTVSGWGFTKNTGTVTSVNNVSPVSGNVTLSIPAAQVNSDWNASSGVAQILNKPTLGTMAAESASDYTPTSSLATVATSGSYNDLSNTPTIPIVNNATLTITQGGTTKGTFTANASSNVTIDLDAGGSNVDIDNTTITENSSDQLQTVAVKDNRSGNAIKTWTGTRAQYDAITTKDSNTLYNITDDTDVTLTLLELLYPVGSIYIGTMATCPLATLGVGTWQLVASDRVLQGAGTGQTVGDTVEAGLPNITGQISSVAYATQTNGALIINSLGAYNQSGSSTSLKGATVISLDASNSNSIYGNSNTVQPPAYIVNIWERTA